MRTVAVIAERLNVKTEVVISRDGVVGDITVMKATSVGSNREAVG